MRFTNTVIVCDDDFNSIKVRLELAMFKNLFAVDLFQFHKGTIRTCSFLVLQIH